MKITKKVTAASTNASVANTYKSEYIECSNHIRGAIEALSTIAANDNIAKDAIADLSVVLLDLQ